MVTRNVFLAPGSKEHMNRSVLPAETVEDASKLQSIEGIIPIDNLKDVLRPEEEAELRRIYSNGRVRLWGARPGLKNVWDKLENGDYVLFYNRNYFICIAETAFKTVNSALAMKVWGEYEDGETWENIFFVKNVRKLNLHRKDFNNIAGYAENFVPQGFMKVGKEEAKERILESIVGPSKQDIVIPPDAEKFIEKFKADPENKAWLERKIVAFEKWRKAFSPENIDKLSREDFRRFLSIKENQSWDGIQRQPNVYADMNKLRRTIKYLVDGVDTSTPQDVQKRLDTILERDAEYEIRGLKRAIVTPILHICDTRNRFGVWNSKIDRAFEKLGLPILKPKASPGERYIAYNNALNLIGEKYGLNLLQVDVLMHKIATEYTPGTSETAPSAFAFTAKDFDSCTGKKDDARYLSNRFKGLLDILKVALGDRFAKFLSYVARPNLQPKRGQKRAEYRDYMWLGFAHPKFERAQKAIQFQVAINAVDPFCINIWIDRRAPSARKLAKQHIEKNRETFEKSLRSLIGYNVGLYDGYELEQGTTELTGETMNEFINNVPTDNTHVHIGKTLSQKEVLSAGPKIVDTIVNTLNDLYPVYSLLVGEPIQGIGRTPSIDKIVSYIESKGFFYPEETIKNYHTSLETKPFVILSGITGIGKTKLTELYANGFHGVDEKNKYYKIIPVQPNWNNKKPLLGYYNPIMETYYKTPFLVFLITAFEDCQSCDFNTNGKCTDKTKCTRKYFVCLDEMNLAHVEYYFADFLSAMESDRIVDLHSTEAKTEDGKMVGPKVRIPENLYIVGTVNIDETTKEFSPKVLDRANTIYLDVVDLDKWLEVQAYTHAWGRSRSVDSYAFGVVKEIHSLLKKHGMHFGYRVCDEILEYVQKSILPKDRALDLQIMQKILPKLSGDDNARLRGSLQDLKEYLENKPYTSSKNKVKNMLDKLEQQGFTSFFD